MSVILAIDPGPKKSAWCFLEDGKPLNFAKEYNHELLLSLLDGAFLADTCVIEKVESFGMPVGADIFETVFWSGRFAEAWGGKFHRIGRKDVKLHLCGNTRAKDANIRQALIDRFGGESALKHNRCPKCKDVGRINCPVCRGRGFTKCPACQGRSRTWKTKECSHCLNRGRAPCGETILCPECNGIATPPGVLHGMATDCWSALAVGLTYLETRYVFIRQFLRLAVH